MLPCHIVYVKLYLTFKNTVGGFNRQLANIDIQLAGDDLRYFVQQSHTAVSYTHLDVYKRQLHSDAPALPKADNDRLFYTVLEDYADITVKRERMKKMKADPYYRCV